jgi:YD repeat-containing protein
MRPDGRSGLSSTGPTGQGIVYAYDAAKWLQSETSFGRTVGFLYDPVGNRTRLTWPDGQCIQYDYDSAHGVPPHRPRV